MSHNCVSDNRPTDLGTSFGHCSGLWTSLSPPQLLSGKPWRTLLNNYPWIREPLWKSSLPGEHFQHTIEAKWYEFGCTGESKRNSLSLPMSPFHQCRTLCAKKDHLSSWFHPRQKARVWVSLHLFQLCGCYNGVHFSLGQSRVLSHGRITGVWDEAGRVADRIFKGH